MHGKGVITYADGSIYEGEFKDNLKNGYGSYAYQNGEKYNGEFLNEMRHGKGILI